jgi:hypothetical protein
MQCCIPPLLYRRKLQQSISRKHTRETERSRRNILLDVAFEGREDRGDVGEDGVEPEKREAEASNAASRAKLDAMLASQIEEGITIAVAIAMSIITKIIVAAMVMAMSSKGVALIIGITITNTMRTLSLSFCTMGVMSLALILASKTISMNLTRTLTVAGASERRL